MNPLPRVLFISASDANWLWLSEAAADRFMLVRESGSFSEISKRIGLVSPALAIVDYSPQVGMEPGLIVQEIQELEPELPIVALGNKDQPDVVVNALRSGVKDFVSLDSAGEEVAKVLATVIEKSPKSKQESAGNAIVILGGRQGTGATTLAVNLAAALAKKNKDHTLLLDFGLPLGDALIHLPAEDKQGAMDFVECVRNLRRFDATLAKTAFRRNVNTGVAILSLPKNLADLRDISASDALKFLNLIKSFFENIVIDLCGFSNIEFVANLLRSADHTLVISPQSVPGIITTAELIKALNDKGVNMKQFELVIAPHRKEVVLDAASIAKKLGFDRFHVLPERSAALTNSVNSGTVLTHTDSKDAYSKAVIGLMDSLSAKASTKAAAGSPKTGKPQDVLSQTFKKWFK